MQRREQLHRSSSAPSFTGRPAAVLRLLGICKPPLPVEVLVAGRAGAWGTSSGWERPSASRSSLPHVELRGSGISTATTAEGMPQWHNGDLHQSRTPTGDSCTDQPPGSGIHNRHAVPSRDHWTGGVDRTDAGRQGAAPGLVARAYSMDVDFLLYSEAMTGAERPAPWGPGARGTSPAASHQVPQLWQTAGNAELVAGRLSACQEPPALAAEAATSGTTNATGGDGASCSSDAGATAMVWAANDAPLGRPAGCRADGTAAPPPSPPPLLARQQPPHATSLAAATPPASAHRWQAPRHVPPTNSRLLDASKQPRQRSGQPSQSGSDSDWDSDTETERLGRTPRRRTGAAHAAAAASEGRCPLRLPLYDAVQMLMTSESLTEGLSLGPSASASQGSAWTGAGSPPGLRQPRQRSVGLTRKRLLV